MANVNNNQKYVSAFPVRLNKREGRVSTHGSSVLVSDSDYSVQDDDGINCVRNSGANSITLPKAISNKGRCLSFIQADLNVLTIAQNADGANINGANADFVDCDAADDQVELFCDGSEWIIIRQNIA